MANRKRVLHASVVIDGKVCQEVHQTKAESLAVGPGSDNDNTLAIFRDRVKTKDDRALAPLWLAIGLVAFLGTLALFAWELSQQAALSEAAKASNEGLEVFGELGGMDGSTRWGLLPVILSLIPLAISYVLFQSPKLSPEKAQGIEVRKYPLFDFRDGGYFLRLPRGTRGTVTIGDREVTVRDLRRKFGTNREFEIRLDDNSRGKLVFGPTTLLFRLDRPAAPPPVLPFPKQFVDHLYYFRTGLVDKIVFAATAAVLVPCFIFLKYIAEPSDVGVPDRFLKAMDLPVARYDAEPEPEEEETEPEEELLKTEPEPKETKKEKEVVTKQLKEKPKTYSQEAVKKARGVGIARVLGTYGGDGKGSVFDVIQSTENDLGALFDAGMTQTALSGGGDVTAFVAGGKGITETGGLMKNEGLVMGSGPGETERKVKREKKIKGKVKSKTTDIFGDVDKKAVRATIQRKQGALRHCYEKALNTRPNLKGKITYTIMISTMGRVTKVLIEEDTIGDPSVQSCTKAKIRGWRFPTEGAEDPSEVTFSVVFAGAG